MKYWVTISTTSTNKIQIIKELRALTGLGLKKAKGVIDDAINSEELEDMRDTCDTMWLNYHVIMSEQVFHNFATKYLTEQLNKDKNNPKVEEVREIEYPEIYGEA